MPGTYTPRSSKESASRVTHRDGFSVRMARERSAVLSSADKARESGRTTRRNGHEEEGPRRRGGRGRRGRMPALGVDRHVRSYMKSNMHVHGGG
ncbi:hypothetical protein GCM10025762_19820 [Haloechinothrix salitolerans]